MFYISHVILTYVTYCVVYASFLLFIYFYCLDIKHEYPKIVILAFHEPIIRFLLYFASYMISIRFPPMGLLMLFIIISIHMDYINLIVV